MQFTRKFRPTPGEEKGEFIGHFVGHDVTLVSDPASPPRLRKYLIVRSGDAVELARWYDVDRTRHLTALSLLSRYLTGGQFTCWTGTPEFDDYIRNGVVVDRVTGERKPCFIEEWIPVFALAVMKAKELAKEEL